ncbi:unnamed protein product [Chrysodeixis includens]|uniref:Distal membrane-arm assembly complex protein 1-like domain-containing protein n=1 Tax=Chrysodeixis includens TaxID=689277 RepID=A0A9N8KU95_CHRIL|nr:unnamed protein product [Chrysodeixis includens]
MTSTVTSRPRDCMACRLVGAAGMIGIGGYLANSACKNSSLSGKYTLSMLSFDKQWAGRREYETPWKDEYVFKNMEKEATTKVVEALSEARVGVSGWEAHGNAWSAALGAVIGAGTVLILAVIVLMWRKPRRSELPLLAPMDVAHSNVFWFPQRLRMSTIQCYVTPASI